MLAGFLPGAIVSGVQMAISAANTGGAWDNAKKYIESGAMVDDDGRKVRKGTDIHKAAVVGDTVGDPLKDTSGPALNILIKLMAILSLVFASKFAQIHPNSWFHMLKSYVILLIQIDKIYQIIYVDIWYCGSFFTNLPLTHMHQRVEHFSLNLWTFMIFQNGSFLSV